jgi:phage terminase large subunit
MTLQDIARDRLRLWKEHPEVMVIEEFGAQPDEWQLDGLRAFPHNNRLAFKACKGPGKTTELAWFILNFLATRPDCRIAATSITGDNLDSNLWPELSKWMSRSRFFSSRFAWTKTSVVSLERPATWWAKARTWPKRASAEQQADALAGLHEDYAMFVGDESGGYPQGLMATAEAVLSGGIETKVVQAGNPTHLEGPLYRACTIDKALWWIKSITGDPDDPHAWVYSPRVNIVREDGRTPLAWAQQQIASYGRENPWVKINVLGEFPDASINALLGVEEVEAAMKRHLRSDAFSWAQKRLGVDVARFGDDRTVIFPRQGAASFRPVIMRNVRTTAIAARVAKAMAAWGAAMVFVDDTGHWGHGVIDNLVDSGLPAKGVIFSDPALHPRYKNRRAEMWLEMAQWVKDGGCLPPLPDLVGELVTPTYSFVGGKFVLEDKDQIKERLGRSPDLADALALTFAEVDMPAEMMRQFSRPAVAKMDSNPYDVSDTSQPAGSALSDSDPWKAPI